MREAVKIRAGKGMQIQPEAQKCLEILRQYHDIVITTHVNPDGDAIGSALGLAWFLKDSLGKNVCIYNESPFPAHFSFLPLPCPYLSDIAEIPFSAPLVVMLDAGELHRFGEAFSHYVQGKKSLCIDHHMGKNAIATEYNWVDHTMAASGQMVAQIVYAEREKTIEETAKALYVALSSDTGNFSFGNTTLACIECLAKLMETPLTVAPLREALDNTWSVQKLHFWGRLMSMVQFSVNNQLASLAVPQTLFAEYGVTKEDLEGFVEQMRKVQGVRMTLLLREERKNNSSFIKISMRSSGDDDVRSILTQFGGGGHKNAAGASVEGSLETVFAMVYPHIVNVLQK